MEISKYEFDFMKAPPCASCHNSNWKKAWMSNYRGEGLCEDLDKAVKKLNYGSRMDVSYLPWAVVERIFKMQDGEIETITDPFTETGTQTRTWTGTTNTALGGTVYLGNTNPQNLTHGTNVVHVDRIFIRDDIEGDTKIPRYMNSFFVIVRVKWLGRQYDERYPLQDSSGKALSVWTQNEVNKALQRAKVKAIANISGIGYKLFEDGDLQFVSDDTPGPDEKLAPAQNKNDVKAKLAKAATPKATEPSTPAENNMGSAISQSLPPISPQVEEQPAENTAKAKKATPDDRIHVESEIKRVFLSGGPEKSALIRGFLKERDTTKVSELSEEDVRGLFALVV